MFVRQIIEKSPDIRIQNPVHLLPHHPRRQRVQCIMGALGLPVERDLHFTPRPMSQVVG
jgi:hypothetical protein